MTVKIRDNQEVQLRDLLGGDDPTPERVSALLDELAERRAGVSAAPVPIEATPADRENILLRASLAHLAAKIDDLSKVKEADAVDQAIGEGRLPPSSVNIQAPPLGWRGLGDIPRGQWLVSPFGIGPGGSGQKMPFYLCDCASNPMTPPGRACTSTREYHFYCIVCKSGPHDIDTRKQIFKRASMSPANLWGVMHYACAGPCTAQFMAMMGSGPSPAIYEVSQTMPTQAVQSAPPQRPMVMAGSD